MSTPQFTGKVKIGKTTYNKTARWDFLQTTGWIIVEASIVGLAVVSMMAFIFIAMA